MKSKYLLKTNQIFPITFQSKHIQLFNSNWTERTEAHIKLKRTKTQHRITKHPTVTNITITPLNNKHTIGDTVSNGNAEASNMCIQERINVPNLGSYPPVRTVNTHTSVRLSANLTTSACLQTKPEFQPMAP